MTEEVKLPASVPRVMEDKAVYLDKLINDHWNYVQQMLVSHRIDQSKLEIAEHHYKAAFRHGWKHHEEYLEGK